MPNYVGSLIPRPICTAQNIYFSRLEIQSLYSTNAVATEAERQRVENGGKDDADAANGRTKSALLYLLCMSFFACLT